MEQALESSRWAGKPFWDIIKPEATGAALTEALHSYAALWVGEDRHASSKGAFFRLGEHAQVSDGFMGGSSSEPTIGALNERLHALMAYITAIEEGHAPPSLVAGRDAFGQLIAEAPWGEFSHHCHGSAHRLRDE